MSKAKEYLRKLWNYIVSKVKQVVAWAKQQLNPSTPEESETPESEEPVSEGWFSDLYDLDGGQKLIEDLEGGSVSPEEFVSRLIGLPGGFSLAMKMGNDDGVA